MPSPSEYSTLTSSFPTITDDAEGIMKWLSHVTSFVNPDSTLGHTLTETFLTQIFLSRFPPPPPSLYAHWTEVHWRFPDEPYPLYVLRCLASHFSLTLLSSRVGFEKGKGTPSVVHPDQSVDPSSAVGEVGIPTGTLLERDVFILHSVRAWPEEGILCQSGWSTHPCPHPSCLTGRKQTSEKRDALPLQFGGATCVVCGDVLPRRPSLTARHDFVLERLTDGRRMPAIAYYTSTALSLRILRLGEKVEVLYYKSQSEQKETLYVIHNARLYREGLRDASLTLEVIQRSLHDRSSAVSFAYQQATQQHTATPERTFQFFTFLTSLLAPEIVGQRKTKALLLLSLLHSLYRRLRPPSESLKEEWKSLHTLILGPSKGGKSTLLQRLSQLYGRHADMVSRTVVYGGTSTKATKNLREVVPHMQGELLTGGGALGSAALLIDELTPGRSTLETLPLLEVLEDGHCSVLPPKSAPDACPFIPTVLPTETQIIATASSEGVGVLDWVDGFPLVVTLTPLCTLEESTAVSAGATRSSASRGRSGSGRRENSLDISNGSASSVFSTLSHDVLLHLLSQSPSAALLVTVYELYGIEEMHRSLLLQHKALVEASTKPSAYRLGTPSKASLPPPSSLRGLPLSDPRCQHSPLFQALVNWSHHLDTLQQLFYSRLLLEGHHRVEQWAHQEEGEGNVPCCLESVQRIAYEVWDYYLSHLHSGEEQWGKLQSSSSSCYRGNRGAFLQPRIPPARQYPVPPTSAYSTMPPPTTLPEALYPDPFPSDAALASHSLSPSPLPQSSPIRGAAMGMTQLVQSSHTKAAKKRSRKESMLYFVECLTQHLSSLPSKEAVVPKGLLQHYYEQLGGADTFANLSCEVLVERLQLEGMLLKRPGGWAVV